MIVSYAQSLFMHVQCRLKDIENQTPNRGKPMMPKFPSKALKSASKMESKIAFMIAGAPKIASVIVCITDVDA
jgi:hypothetical protein